MIKVKIYQIKDIQNCKYSFMSYDYAEDKLDMNDYVEVASFPTSDDDDKILNWVWEAGNTGILQKDFKMRSVSMSDIIEVDGNRYYVDTFGFKEV